MKKSLLIFLLFPILGFTQHRFPMIDYFPFTNDILPAPIQLNSSNLFLPKIDFSCTIQGRATTYFNSYSPFVGDTLAQYSTYRSYYDFSEMLDSVPWGAFYSMYFIEMDSTNSSYALSCPGSGFSSYSYTYICDDSGNILFYNLSGFGPFSYGSYFYDDNGLAILNNLQPQPPVGLNTPFNSYDIQWADTNKLCTVMDSSNVISSYIFDEGGNLINYYNVSNQSSNIDSATFLYNNENLIIQSTFLYNNGGQLTYDYSWIDENNVEMTINDINSDNYMLSSENQVIHKVIYELDSSLYARNLTYLDSNLNEIIRYKYHFCEDDTVVYGCTNSDACNFNLSANYDDGLCFYFDICGECGGSGPDYGMDCNGNCLDDIDLDGICDAFEIGCTDVLACNYDPSALMDDSSCVYAELYYTCDGVCFNDFDLDGVCDELDNCIDISNSNQNDIDEDDEGDACDYDDGIGVNEIKEDTPTLIKMIDVLGREQQEHNKGSLLFYIYDNGKVEKKFNL